MFRLNGRFALAIVTAAMAQGCASAPMAGPVFEGVSADSESIQLTVDNRVFWDVVIYSEIPGSRVRLGTVTGGMNQQFRIPKHHQLSSNLRLVADPVGSPHAWTSDPIAAHPGTEIRWTVHENRGVRTLSVW